MGFFDDLKAAAIEEVKEKVKEELAELGIDLDEDDDDADIDEAPEPEPEEIAAEEPAPPAQDDDGGERPVSAWSTPLNVTTSSPPSAPAVASSNYSPSTTSFPRPDADTTFNEAVQKLWDLDTRLIPNQDYKIDVQSSKHPSNKEDAAEEPLFTYVKPAVFRKRPTFTTFVALLNNYSAYTGEEEDVTEQELQENRAFLNEVMKTAPMKYCHQYCIAKGCTYKGEEISGSESEFKRILNSIWFELYSRSGRRNMDSSGFEHVFVGEVKNGQVSGFHNWIMFYLEEKRGNVDFRGYIKPKSRESSTAETNDDDAVLTLQFRWNGVEKFVGTCFIGVTPEFEMALYTMAFLASEEDENAITLDAGGEKFDLNVKCHKYDRNTKVGSCYVEALAHYE